MKNPGAEGTPTFIGPGATKSVGYRPPPCGNRTALRALPTPAGTTITRFITRGVTL